MEITPIVERLDHAIRLLEQLLATARLPPLPLVAVPRPADEGLWNAEQVAAYLRCSESKVYKAAEAGTLPCVRHGRSLRFEPESIRAYIRGRAPDVLEGLLNAQQKVLKPETSTTSARRCIGSSSSPSAGGAGWA